jgi:hypothetical protein
MNPETSAATLTSTTSAKKKKKRRRSGKRGREKISEENEKGDNKRTKKSSKPLNGLILAISTQESKSGRVDGDSPDLSYKEVSSLCEKLGAIVSAQVSKKVFAVICNKSAVRQSTQRVRKALKKYTAIVDIEWLQKCEEEGEKVDHSPFSLTSLARDVSAGREQLVKKSSNADEVHVEFESDEDILKSDIGWSEPVSFGCSCVCHDDGRTDCPWCINCSVTIARLKSVCERAPDIIKGE